MKIPMNEQITMFKKQFNFLSMAVHPFPTSELSFSVYHSLCTQKVLCGKLRAYTSPANFMPQLMRVSYIRRVRARLSCGV